MVLDRLAFRIAWPFALLAAALAGAVGWDAARRAGEGVEQRLEARLAIADELLARLPGAYEQERLLEVRPRSSGSARSSPKALLLGRTSRYFPH